jgi:hypothetical protein
MLSEIADQMSDPQVDDELGEEETDESTQLDPSFENMISPPSITIANVALRKRLEKSMPALDVDSLFLRGEIRQDVTILRDKLTVTFRTLSGKEDLFIKKKLSGIKSEVVRYIEDRYMMMQLAAHIVCINDEELPSMIKGGEINDETFEKRFDKVCVFPVFIIERIWVHWVWFQDRVTNEINNDFLRSG